MKIRLRLINETPPNSNPINARLSVLNLISHNKIKPTNNCGLYNRKELIKPASKKRSSLHNKKVNAIRKRLSKLFCPKLIAANTGNQVNENKKGFNLEPGSRILKLAHRMRNPDTLQKMKLRKYGKIVNGR